MMDIEKLVERIEQIICCGEACLCPGGDCFQTIEAGKARAVLALAFAAAAEEAKARYPSTSKYDDRSVFYGSDLNPDRSEFGRGKQAGREAASVALRTLATQLGGDNG